MMNDNTKFKPKIVWDDVPVGFKATEARLLLGVLLTVFLITVGSGIAFGQTNNTCNPNCPPPPERKKTKYAKVPENISDARRRAILRMQPKYIRWNYTAWQPVRMVSDNEH
jgi:hypothetical protein